MVTQSNLQYWGAFRVPNGQYGSDNHAIFSFTSGAIAYNPAHNSLFLASHVYDNYIAEISIPSLVNSTNLDSLNTATVLQPFASVLDKLQYNDSSDPANELGGLMVVNGQLIGTGWVYYDAGTPTMFSHFYTSSLNLAIMSVVGLCQVGNMGGGYVGGYMCPVPSNWQGDLGAPYLTGLYATNISSRTSCGPAAFGFNSSQLSSSQAAAAIPYVYYQTQIHPTIGEFNSSPPTEFNCTAQIGGVLFVPGTRSILYFGSMGTGPFCYGEPGPTQRVSLIVMIIATVVKANIHWEVSIPPKYGLMMLTILLLLKMAQNSPGK